MIVYQCQSGASSGNIEWKEADSEKRFSDTLQLLQKTVLIMNYAAFFQKHVYSHWLGSIPNATASLERTLFGYVSKFIFHDCISPLFEKCTLQNCIL